MESRVEREGTKIGKRAVGQALALLVLWQLAPPGGAIVEDDVADFGASRETPARRPRSRFTDPRVKCASTLRAHAPSSYRRAFQSKPQPSMIWARGIEDRQSVKSARQPQPMSISTCASQRSVVIHACASVTPERDV